MHKINIKCEIMRIHTTEQLSARQSMTPEGYLLCEGVGIARTGYQLYAAGEIPLEPDDDGLITIQRPESEVFRDATMASFEGKPVTMDHPADGVGPENWSDLAIGITQNVRRGAGLDSDLLVADLLVTDAAGIEAVRARPGEAVREVSCGYDARYVQTAPGAGYQTGIVGNHVALVERGRAGPRCSIQDKAPIMATKKESAWARALRTAFATKDSDALEAAIKSADAEPEPEDDDDKAQKKTADALANLAATVDGLAKTVDALVKAKTKDDGMRADGINDLPDPKTRTQQTEDDEMDDDEKSSVNDSMKHFAERAEILAPGFKLATTDSVKRAAHVADAQRRVLGIAIQTEDGKACIAPLLAGRTLDKLSVDATGAVFIAATEMTRQRNNARGARYGIKTNDFGGKPKTPAEINAANAAFWKR